MHGRHWQWRRQTIKSSSAFKRQLYFQVGQMEGPNVLSETRDLVRSVGAPSGQGLGTLGSLGAMPPAMPPEKFATINFEIAYFLQF